MIRCMLTRRSCSGFERDDLWGYRALEPSRCCIASIALVLLKTGISHSASAENHSDAASPSSENGPAFSEDGTGGMQVDAQQLATAQKLLLFWRKPAVRPSLRLSSFLSSSCLPLLQRKCWWDATNVVVRAGTDKEETLKVWARRVWTLELSLI